MQRSARSKQDEAVVDDWSAFVFPPTIDPAVREKAWADERLRTGTICRKTRNHSPTHRFPGGIIFPENSIQFLPILDGIAVVNRKPGNYTVGDARFVGLQWSKCVHLIDSLKVREK